MPYPFRYLTCSRMPSLAQGESIESNTQLAMPWGNDQAHSILTYNGRSESSMFERYWAEHQSEKVVNAIFNHEPVRKLIVIKKFLVFFNRSDSYFLAQTGKQEAKSFFERFQRDGTILAETVKIEVNKIKENRFGATTGGWFNGLKIADVKSIGIFGSEQIENSDEWTHYEQVGELSAVLMRVADNSGAERRVLLTADRLVMLYQDNGEKENLDFVAHVNTLIDAC